MKYMKTTPYAHQAECLETMKDKREFAVFMEQGLGKTKTLLDNAAYLYEKGKLGGVLVLAPNGVHANWIRREIPTHLYDGADVLSLEYSAGKSTTKYYERAWKKLLAHTGLAIFAINMEAVSAGTRAFQACRKFIHAQKPCMIIVDESSRIKTPGSKRTKRIVALGKQASYRRIATGTPVTQTPFDLYSQFRFLNQNLLGFTSYYAFKHNYGVWKKEVAQRDGKVWEYETLLKLVRLDDLQQRLLPHSYRRTKAECLDLPEKVYQTVTLPMTADQKQLYNRMSDEGVLEFDDFELLAENHLVKLMRLQQITGGFLPTEEGQLIEGEGWNVPTAPLPGRNPKMEYLLTGLLDEYSGKTIIWARFRSELYEIIRRLRQAYGKESLVELHGGVTGRDREAGIDRFQNDPDCRFIVGQQQSGIGVTLHAAENVFYYSNPFSYEQRYQSEDRAHRIGLKHTVTYVDLVMDGTVDERVRDVLEKAKMVADEVTGDNARQKGKENG